jgi:8-oxo-dGTP diphosphatase
MAKPSAKRAAPDGGSSLAGASDAELRAELQRRGLLEHERPEVGCGVLVLSAEHPRCVLVGRRRGEAPGEGAWALPGGDVERGEEFEACAAREALEGTGLALSDLRHVRTTNAVRQPGYHCVVAFVAAEAAAGAVAVAREPEKCEGWKWVDWEDAPEWEQPVCFSLQALRATGFNPFEGADAAAHAAAGLSPVLPGWAAPMAESADYQRVLMREWEDESWRRARGWYGSDLIHGRHAAVRVLAYWWNPSQQTLSGVVRFNPGAESHRGICHGGAMTSVLDDVLGHCCFMGGGGPWVGATVKLDVTLKAPVKVGATLRVVGQILEKTESKGGRFKVKIAARLEEGEAIEGKETPECYAEMNGLSIEGVRLPSPVAHDAVDERVWLPTTGALAEKRDSGWEME